MGRVKEDGDWRGDGMNSFKLCSESIESTLNTHLSPHSIFVCVCKSNATEPGQSSTEPPYRLFPRLPTPTLPPLGLTVGATQCFS